MLSLSHWRSAVLKPIDEENAVGVSARLGEVFDQLQQEVSRDLALEGEATDWRKVLVHSHEIIANQSKDLLVLLYSMRAVIDAHRYEGFAESLSVLISYLDQYWVDSYPPLKRKRARVAAFEWFAQQIEMWVELNNPEQEEKCYVESVVGSIKSVNQSLSSLGSEWHLDLFSVSRKLNDYLSNLPVEATSSGVECKSELNKEPVAADVVPINGGNIAIPNISEASPASNNRPSAASGMGNPQIGISDDKSYNQCIRDTQSSLKSLAKYRLAKDLTDALAYEINRFSVWLPVTELPLNKNGLTPLRSMPAEKRHFFETLFQQRQYEILIIELESSLSNAPFWLDGHRMVVDSLKAIDAAMSNSAVGIGYQKAIDTITDLINSFISRLEGVERLTFSDGTPFADDETRSWLASIKPSHQERTEKISEDFSLAPVAELCEATDVDEVCSSKTESKVINNSKKAYKDAGFSEGFSILDQYCREQTSKKAWYKARLLAIEYCFNAKEFIFAEQLLMELDEISLSHKLEIWEPEVASNMLSMMLVCQSKLKRKPMSGSYYQRLVRVDTKRGYEMKSFAG